EGEGESCSKSFFSGAKFDSTQFGSQPKSQTACFAAVAVMRFEESLLRMRLLQQHKTRIGPKIVVKLDLPKEFFVQTTVIGRLRQHYRKPEGNRLQIAFY